MNLMSTSQLDAALAGQLACTAMDEAYRACMERQADASMRQWSSSSASAAFAAQPRSHSRRESSARSGPPAGPPASAPASRADGSEPTTCPQMTNVFTDSHAHPVSLMSCASASIFLLSESAKCWWVLAIQCPADLQMQAHLQMQTGRLCAASVQQQYSENQPPITSREKNTAVHCLQEVYRQAHPLIEAWQLACHACQGAFTSRHCF